MSTIIRVNGTIQFTFFMRLNVSFVTSCVILVLVIFLSLKLENGLKKYARNVAEIKYGFVKIIVIF